MTAETIVLNFVSTMAFQGIFLSSKQNSSLLVFLLACNAGLNYIAAYSMALQSHDIVFVIMSQEESYHAKQALRLKESIVQQAQATQQGIPKVYLFHEDFLHPGGWTILPIIPRLHKFHGRSLSWLMFLEPSTEVNLPELLKELMRIDKREKRLKNGLANEGKNQGMWVGHGLIDKEPTIIHHFLTDGKIMYPHFSAGFAMDKILLDKLVEEIEEHGLPGEESDFSIDASHELALFIWNSGQGVRLTHSEAFCLTSPQDKAANKSCVTWPLPFKACGDVKSPESVYFAVKTCSKFHHDRIPVIKSTWGKYAAHINYFSDVEDPVIPTINLGIPNTEHGHCDKTKAIIKHISEKIKDQDLINIKWVVLVDDDTILSVSRLLSLLTCFENYESTPKVVGERYGYRVCQQPEGVFPFEFHGYNYATGGGGVALNRKAIDVLSKPETCICPAPDAPDDM
ncbi:hypothetical protein J437_LFUL006500, partial [Ladona fulva]